MDWGTISAIIILVLIGVVAYTINKEINAETDSRPVEPIKEEPNRNPTADEIAEAIVKAKKKEQTKILNYGFLGFIVFSIILYILIANSGIAEWILDTFDL